MKRQLLTLLFGCVMAGVASATSFLDKTSNDQLTYRSLAPGQVAWNEEDGSAIMYVGSPSEDKNLRVIDPAALRGYRYKQITEELTLNGDSTLTASTNGTFKLNSFNPSIPHDGFRYYTVIGTNDVVKASGDEEYIEYFSYDPYTGEYSLSNLPVGFRINVDSDAEYYTRKKYWEYKVEIISKYSNIQSVDYLYQEVSSGGLTMITVNCEREIVYDGRKATLYIRLLEGTTSGVWFTVSAFTATCSGIGDNLGHVNDTTSTTFMIKDKEGTYNLADLRHNLWHKYDGNRGEDWSKYPAYGHVKMMTYPVIWTDTNKNINCSIGISGDSSMIMAFEGSSFLKYTKASASDLAGTPYEGLQITITDIMGAPTNRKTVSDDYDGNNDYSAYITSDKQIGIPFVCSVSLPGGYIEVMYKEHLDDPFWLPIAATLYDVSELKDGTHWLAVIPEEYYVNCKTGFWKINTNVLAAKNNLQIKAGVTLIGDDGKMYKLTFPNGGGAVTAELVE